MIKSTASHSSDVIVFCFVAKTRSFTRAAHLLGISRSLVSKRVSRLEQRLDTRLVHRSTRSMSLTSAGELLYRRYSDINDRLDRAEREVQDLHRTHTGLIRLAAPMICAYAGASLVSSLQRQFPNIEIEVIIDEGPPKVIESGYDAALHVGKLEDSNLICRKIATIERVVCASPGYVARSGTPLLTNDLANHNCLVRTPGAGDDKRWWFGDAADQPYAVPVSGDFQANDDVVLLRACLAGMGLCQLPRLLVEEHLQSGGLLALMPSVPAVLDDVFVVLPHRDVPEKVRAAVDFLTEQMEKRYPQAPLHAHSTGPMGPAP